MLQKLPLLIRPQSEPLQVRAVLVAVEQFSLPNSNWPRELFGIRNASNVEIVPRPWTRLSLAMDPIRMSIARLATARNGDHMGMALPVVPASCKPMEWGKWKELTKWPEISCNRMLFSFCHSSEEEIASNRPFVSNDTTSIKAPAGQGCPRCGGAVFAAEQQLAKGTMWHKKCFNCAECHRPLDSMLACDGPDKEIHCRACYGKLFGPKGFGYGHTPTLSTNGEMNGEQQ